MIQLSFGLIVLLFVSDSVSPIDQPRARAPEKYLQGSTPYTCNQSTSEQNSLMTRAEKENFTVRRVEFLGLTHTPDQIVRNRMTFINEGDVFSRKKLARSLQNMSKLKRTIYPVALKDVVLELKDPKVVDMLICFRERRR